MKTKSYERKIHSMADVLRLTFPNVTYDIGL
jgi:hypothetical protein